MRMDTLQNITLYHGNCMDYMRELPDKYFELAIVDPPYGRGRKLITKSSGAGADKWANTWAKKFYDDFQSNMWDHAPDKSYFSELFRVSKNQVIWGGNYFDLPPSRGYIVWDKMVYLPTMSQIELAYTSFDRHSRLVKINNSDPNRIHITQKPVALYEWILQNYAKQGDRILDTHLGSASIAIACLNMGFEMTGCEIDGNYYKKGKARLIAHQAQRKMF